MGSKNGKGHNFYRSSLLQVIHHEDLVRDPQKILTQVFDWMGESFDENLAEKLKLFDIGEKRPNESPMVNDELLSALWQLLSIGIKNNELDLEKSDFGLIYFEFYFEKKTIKYQKTISFVLFL